ncbi:MAG: hypothetical protein RIS75_681 [Actinomycetota bacterium]
MRLDHVSYAVSHNELVDTVQRLGALLGSGFNDGGRHPSFGTSNFILPLKNGTYFEVVAALDHPSAERAPFGQAVRNRAEDGGGWLGWVVAVDDISNIESRLGREAVDGHRRRPDGVDLAWKQVGVKGLMNDPQLPFFIQWITPSELHPAHNGSGVSLRTIEICGDQDVISEYLGEPSSHPLDDVDVVWVDADEPGIVAVTFESANGTVRID